MATFSILPGTLNLAVKKGDRFSTIVDFDVSLTGYTVTSHVVSVVTGSTVSAITVDSSLFADGKVGISLSDVQTENLAGTYRWRLDWDSGSAPRTALEGFFEVVP